jgi:hypothetical protein
MDDLLPSPVASLGVLETELASSSATGSMVVPSPDLSLSEPSPVPSAQVSPLSVEGVQRKGDWRSASLTRKGLTWTLVPGTIEPGRAWNAELSLENGSDEAVSLDPDSGWALLDERGGVLEEGPVRELGDSLVAPVNPGEDARANFSFKSRIPDGAGRLQLRLRDSRGDVVELDLLR